MRLSAALDFPERDWVRFTYWLFGLGLLVWWCAVLAMALAMTRRPHAPAGLARHYTWLVRSFWLAFCMAVFALSALGISATAGLTAVALFFLWYVSRVWRGLRWLRTDRTPGNLWQII